VDLGGAGWGGITSRGARSRSTSWISWGSSKWGLIVQLNKGLAGRGGGFAGDFFVVDTRVWVGWHSGATMSRSPPHRLRRFAKGLGRRRIDRHHRGLSFPGKIAAGRFSGRLAGRKDSRGGDFRPRWPVDWSRRGEKPSSLQNLRQLKGPAFRSFKLGPPRIDGLLGALCMSGT